MWYWKYKFSDSQVISCWPLDQMVMWLLGWEPIPVSQHLACFGVHGSSAGAHKMHLIYHVTSHKDLIAGSCKFRGGSSLLYVTILISLVTINIVIVEVFFIWQVTPREHMFKGLCEFMGRRIPHGKLLPCQFW